MEPRRVFPIYALILLGLLVVTGFTLPDYYDMPYPKTIGPKFDPHLKKGKIDYIFNHRVDMVLIGDSVLYTGVDQELLSTKLGMETYNMGGTGTGSAVWYLILKNVILESAYSPRYVVILFRDTMLTVPHFRTTGPYFGLLDNYARGHEPLVTQLAFVNRMNPLEKLAEQYLPLYGARRQIREGVDYKIRYFASSLIPQCLAECTENALKSIFGIERMDVSVLNQAVEAADLTFYSPEMMDFDGQINKSFLPEIVRLTKENRIQLILVRAKRRNYPSAAYEAPALSRYIADLYAYLENKHVHYLDLAYDERIKPEYFSDSIHLNAEGKLVFTNLLAEELKPILDQP